MSLLAAVGASVGGSLVSGLLNKKDSKQTNTTKQKLNLRRLVKDAKKAGFNPLTVLQATGGSGWSSTTQTSASDLDIGSMAAAAAVSGVSDYFLQAQQRDLMDAQIDLTKAEAQGVEQAMAGYTAKVREVPTAASNHTTVAPGVTRHSAPEVMTVAPVQPKGSYGGPMSPDMTVYNSMGDPLELETWAMGGAVQGELPNSLHDLGHRNYPRLTHMFTSAWQNNISIYDNAADEIETIKREGFGSPRKMTDSEIEQLENQSWLFRNLGFNVKIKKGE